MSSDLMMCSLSFFFPVAMGIGLAASIIFIVLQIIFLVDFAHSWAENWYDPVYWLPIEKLPSPFFLLLGFREPKIMIARFGTC